MTSDRRQIVRAWLLILQLGLTGIAAIGVCIGAGLLIRYYYNKDYMLFFCILGIVSAVYSTYTQAKKSVGRDDEAVKIVEGMYDGSKDLETPDEEDPVMEDFKLLNERRQETLKQAGQLHEQ